MRTRLVSTGAALAVITAAVTGCTAAPSEPLASSPVSAAQVTPTAEITLDVSTTSFRNWWNGTEGDALRSGIHEAAPDVLEYSLNREQGYIKVGSHSPLTDDERAKINALFGASFPDDVVPAVVFTTGATPITPN